MLELSDRVVTDSGHEPKLMIDQDERGVLGCQRLVRPGCVEHGVFLWNRRLSCGCGGRSDANGGLNGRKPGAFGLLAVGREAPSCRTVGPEVVKIATQRPMYWTIGWRMLDLNDFFYFVQVADRGGLTAASRTLRIPKSTLSHRIQ
jgi:hypothetical protein